MNRPLRVLITGFGAFPGAPYNPTPRLVDRLVRLRRPALVDVDLISHIFHVSYGAVDRELASLIADRAPDALMMFGLAQRTPFVRVETRARNTVTALWPDASHARVGATRIAQHGPANKSFGPHTTLLLQAARDSCVWVKSSRDAGRYVCNYLSWRAIEATEQDQGPRVATFIHVPLIPRGHLSRRSPGSADVGLEELVDASEAMLMTLIKVARQRALQHLPDALINHGSN